ncbi:hypothetical protein [Rubrivirga sp.]|uniref:hypothetical protein n=1 Tax=Rubrivirga sp. TaxID=1885344 RepID=UPI003C73ADA3
MTRTLVALILLAGCSGDPATGPSGSASLDATVASVAAGILGPTVEPSPLVCPDLEGESFGEYACTSTVDGQEVAWAMTVSQHATAADSFSVNLLPDFGSPSANAERGLMKGFRQDLGMTLTSVTCPTMESPAQTVTCQGLLNGTSFDLVYEGSADQSFGYSAPGYDFKANIERIVGDGLAGDDGPPAIVECDAPSVFESQPGFETLCQARSPETGQSGTVRYVVLEGGQYEWNLVPGA